MAPKVYTLRALTDIWTGDAQGKPDRTITTGLLGSIRWWFEIVVRGLGGSACDPTRHQCEGDRHCVVCEFFGCTGWARKFRFEVLDQSGKTKAAQIKKDDVLQFRFTALRPVCKQEWALLDLTLRLIAEYGAIGGKTVYKPSDEPGLADLDLTDFREENQRVSVCRGRKSLPLQKGDIILCVGDTSITSLNDVREATEGKLSGEPVQLTIERERSTQRIRAWFGKRHHIDHGLIQVVSVSENLQLCDSDQMEGYIRQQRWRKPGHDDFAWASLANFWCVKGRYLARQNTNTSTFNRIIGRPEPKAQSQQGDSWLAGRRARGGHNPQPAESKKVFSFKEPECGRRTFGFVKPDVLTLEGMRQRLNGVWPELRDEEFITVAAILQHLLTGQGETRS